MFIIHLHSIDLPLLYKIHAFFARGRINIATNGKTASFDVKNLLYIINVIIPHFNKYPLQRAKAIDFES